LSDKTLERVYWTVLDQAVDSQPRVQTLLTGVRTLEFRYMDERGEWQGQWPPASGERTPEENRLRLPMAVELKLEHERYGELTRLYRLPEPVVEEKPQAQPETPPPPSEPSPSPSPSPAPAPAPVQEVKV
jgi:general secretion pathway protein J